MATSPNNGNPFTDLITLREHDPSNFSTTIDSLWTVGPKVHGGCMTAAIAAAARQSLSHAGAPTQMQPIAISASFLHAPDPGEVTLTTMLRKHGRQVCHVDVQLKQDDRVAVSAAVTLGTLDSSDPLHQIHQALSQLPAEPTADAIRVTPDHPIGQIVNFAQGCDLRIDPSTALFLEGQVTEPVTRIWLRAHDQDQTDPDTAILFAIMAGDASTPVTLNRGLFGWTPTVQLTTYVRRRPAPGWLRVIANAAVLGQSWFEEDHLILDATGQVVVQSRQLAMTPKKPW